MWARIMLSFFKKILTFGKSIVQRIGAINFRVDLKPLFQRKKTQLYGVWKRFLKQIPGTFRPLLKGHKNAFLVLGEVSSGKTELIRRFTERERDIYPFEVTYTPSAELQCYLSGSYVVQELSWDTIEDRSVEVRQQLSYLWQRVYKRVSPIVVVTFNPQQWDDQQRVCQHARTIVQKLALLSHIIKEPVKVRVVITHLDGEEGFVVLRRVLSRHGISLHVAVEGASVVDPLNSVTDMLSLVLLNSTAEEYMKVLGFLKRWPTLFKGIEQLISTLKPSGAEKKMVSLERLFLSPSLEEDREHPFSCANPTTTPLLMRSYLFKHQVACLSLLLVSGLFLGSKYLYEKREMAAIEKEVAILERYQSPELLVDSSQTLKLLTSKGFCDLRLGGLPSFFYYPHVRLKQEFMKHSSTYVLAPALRRALMESDSEVKVIYLLSLMEARQHNRLGVLISENIEEWAKVVGLPDDYIASYIALADDGVATTVVEAFDQLEALFPPHPLTDYRKWWHCLDHLTQAVAKPHILETTLRELRAEASELLIPLQKLKEHKLLPFICKLLSEESPEKLGGFFRQRIAVIQTLRDNSVALEECLSLVCRGEVERGVVDKEMSLSQFLVRLKERLYSEDPASHHTYHFLLAGRTFSFETEGWHQLLVRMQARESVNRYLLSNHEVDGKLFFIGMTEVLDVELPYLSHDFPLFGGRRHIDGIYTQAAYMKQLVPVVDTLTAVMASPLLEMESKQQLNKFVLSGVESYAREYKKHYQELFTTFALQTSSLEEVESFLSRVVEPLSSFTQFLQLVSHNIKIPTKESSLLQPLKIFSDFSFLEGLIAVDESKPTPWHFYQEILRDVLADLSMSGDSHGEELLERYLTPVARVSLEMLTQSSESYLKKTTTWLSKQGVPGKYHSFFLQPILKVYELGLRDLKIGLEAAWAEECHPLMCAIADKFPFHASGEEVATVEEIENVFHPAKEVWQRIHRVVMAVSKQRNGKWEPLDAGLLALDNEIYAATNRYCEVSGLLWDSQGNPKALELRVQTVPSESIALAQHQLPVLSYLIVDQQSIFNMNQHPTWEKIRMEWWKPSKTHVGVELLNVATKAKSYSDMKREGMLWSFFHVLQRGEVHDGTVWRWSLGDDVMASEAYFRFETDPWQLLQIAPFKMHHGGERCGSYKHVEHISLVGKR